jgi:hypothetical protein
MKALEQIVIAIGAKRVRVIHTETQSLMQKNKVILVVRPEKQTQQLREPRRGPTDVCKQRNRILIRLVIVSQIYET